MGYISVLEQKPSQFGVKAFYRHLVKYFFDRLYTTFSKPICSWVFRRDFNVSDSVPARECLLHFTHETCPIIRDHCDCVWDSKRCERCSQLHMIFQPFGDCVHYLTLVWTSIVHMYSTPGPLRVFPGRDGAVPLLANVSCSDMRQRSTLYFRYWSNFGHHT